MKNRPWTDEDDCLLETYYGEAPTGEIAECLGRSPNAIKQHARKRGLDSGRFLTPLEIDTIRSRFPHERTEVIAADLKRSYRSVAQWAHNARIRKTAEYMKTVGFEKGSQVGAPYRFKPGQVPTNKGLRRPGYSIGRGRMSETTFKKGIVPANYMPPGTIVRDRDGFQVIKVYDAPVYVKGEGRVGDGKPWAYLHRRVWIDRHGPIPPKVHIAFKDGNKENVDIDNLERVSFEEMCRRNSMHNLPAELVEVIRLKGSIRRKLRRHNAQEQTVGPEGSSLRDARSA